MSRVALCLGLLALIVCRPGLAPSLRRTLWQYMILHLCLFGCTGPAALAGRRDLPMSVLGRTIIPSIMK